MKLPEKKIIGNFQQYDLKFQELDTVPSDIGRIYRTPVGDFPSVTTVLSVNGNKGLDEWRERVGDEEADRVSKEATNRGTLLHKLCEDYLRGKEISFPHSILKDHFFQIKKVLDKVEIVYANEIPLYSKVLGVAGRCECVDFFNGRLQIIDFKTSKHYKDEDHIKNYYCQASAYCYMFSELFDFTIRDFSIIITNLFENDCSVFEGSARDHLQEFVEMKNKWYEVNNYV